MTTKEQKQEAEKCIEDPVYFYNTYIRKPHQREMTQERFNELKDMMHNSKRTKFHFVKFPETFDDCIKPQL